jgi:hypothetical protein
MEVLTRGLDIKAGAAKLKADRAARLEAELVVDDRQGHAVVAHDPGLADRPDALAGCLLSGLRHPSRAIDLRTVDRHPLASVGTLVLGLGCAPCGSWRGVLTAAHGVVLLGYGLKLSMLTALIEDGLASATSQDTRQRRRWVPVASAARSSSGTGCRSTAPR